MLQKGCRNFIFLSRSGADKAEAADVIKCLEQAGASVQVVRADAGDERAVTELVASADAELPIRGVIHAAMILQVRRATINRGITWR